MTVQSQSGRGRRAGLLGMGVWLVLAVGLGSAAGGPSVARTAMLTVCPSGCAYTPAKTVRTAQALRSGSKAPAPPSRIQSGGGALCAVGGRQVQ